jgi:hypothetical protein
LNLPSATSIRYLASIRYLLVSIASPSSRALAGQLWALGGVRQPEPVYAVVRTLSLPNLSLIAAVVSCLIQVGAQLFAVVVVVATVTEAPPRSLAMLAGECGYDSGPFWDVVPMVTSVLLLVALATNWKTPRRRLLLGAAVAFVVAGLFAAFVMEPVHADVVSAGYRDAVDEGLRARAAWWHTLDWISWALVLVVGLLLSFALATPVPDRSRPRDAV